MFPGLENSISLDEPDTTNPMNYLIDNLSDVTPSRTLKMKSDQTTHEIIALIVAIETHGLSPALLAFANYNGVLASAVPSIASLESLEAEPSTEDAARVIDELISLLDLDSIAVEALILPPKPHFITPDEIHTSLRDAVADKHRTWEIHGVKSDAELHKKFAADDAAKTFNNINNSDIMREFNKKTPPAEALANHKRIIAELREKANAKRIKDETAQSLIKDIIEHRANRDTRTSDEIVEAAVKAANLPHMAETVVHKAEDAVAGAAVNATVSNARSSVVGIMKHIGIWAVVACVAIGAYYAYKHWKRGKSTTREASVVPYEFLSNHLRALAEVPHICQHLEQLILPKSQDDYHEFMQRVTTIARPLYPLGVRVDAQGDIVAEAFPKPEMHNIESLGYHENALSEIAELSARVKSAGVAMQNITLASLTRQYEAIPAEHRRYATEGYNLITDIMHSSVVRMGRTLRLAENTTDSIRQFYEKA